MRQWIVVLAVVCALTFMFIGCVDHSKPSTGHGQYECGPEGCPIPDDYGKIQPRPTTMPQSPVSPVR